MLERCDACKKQVDTEDVLVYKIIVVQPGQRGLGDGSTIGIFCSTECADTFPAFTGEN